MLYNHESEDRTKKYRSRTFVPTGPEMDTVRRSKHLWPNHEVQVSSFSFPQNSEKLCVPTNPENMKSSFLVDVSNHSSVPYDMSMIDLDLSETKVPAANENGKRWPNNQKKMNYKYTAFDTVARLHIVSLIRCLLLVIGWLSDLSLLWIVDSRSETNVMNALYWWLYAIDVIGSLKWKWCFISAKLCNLVVYNVHVLP